MIYCKKASELMDKKNVQNLVFQEEIALKLHLAICAPCRKYKKQSRFIQEILEKQIQQQNPDNIPQTTNEALKEKIIVRLKQN